MHKEIKIKKEVVRLDGHLHEITTHSHKGKILHKVVSPLMVEFHPRDLLQIMLGATILAIPVGFTEETWNLGEILPLPNILTILGISVLFIATFVYYNYYKHHSVKKHWGGYMKRVIATYVVSLIIVAFLLTAIQITAWTPAEWLISFKRVVIVAFPASMSAAVADFLK